MSFKPNYTEVTFFYLFSVILHLFFNLRSSSFLYNICLRTFEFYKREVTKLRISITFFAQNHFEKYRWCKKSYECTRTNLHSSSINKSGKAKKGWIRSRVTKSAQLAVEWVSWVYIQVRIFALQKSIWSKAPFIRQGMKTQSLNSRNTQIFTEV